MAWSERSYDNDYSSSYKAGRSERGGYEDRSGSGRGCHKCGQEGHFARECPTQDRPRGCFNCGKDGHMSRECTEPRKQQQGRDRGSRGCFNCGEEGHMSRECPNGGGSGRDRSEQKPKGCFNCGEEGHFSRECPQERKQRPRECYKCGKEGHIARDCTAEGGDRDSDRRSKGHSRYD
mmetsp:Transcript_28861/g.51430  ORF Transcript_28861/g.51430 Transcript_28861/m.51430 type:complete len:177 (+) Transcript_28861:6-536(+)